MKRVAAAVVIAVAALGPAGAGASEHDRAVLVLVPDLVWENAPRELDGYAKANLSVRTARVLGEPEDGYLTIGKGERTRVHADTGLGAVEDIGSERLRLANWDALGDYDADLDYEGRLGALAEALRDAGVPTVFVAGDRRGAAAAVTHDGTVPRARLGDPPPVRAALDSGARAVIVAVERSHLTGVLRHAESAACVLVASVSTPDRGNELGVVAASPRCGYGRAGLGSSSTRQPHLVSITDVPATFLSQLGVARPAEFVGVPVERDRAVSRPTLIDRGEESELADSVRTIFVWSFVVLHAIGAIVAASVARARPAVAFVLLALPGASFLAMLFPWWRGGFPAGAATIAAVAAVIAAAAVVTARGDVRRGALVAVGASAAIIGVDALLGGPLEIDAPFGNSPIRAGRFYGVGNIGFGFLAASAIVVAGLVLDRWRGRALVAAAVLAGTVVAIGAPSFGADAGGVLSAVPAFGAFLLLRNGGRLTPRRAVPLALVAVAAFGAFVAADLLRSSDEQTHLGRAVVDRDFVSVALRKGERALATLKTPMANVIWIGAAVLAVRRPRVAHRPALRAAAWALVLLGVVGSVLNDSGLQVGAAVAAIAWPTFCVATR